MIHKPANPDVRTHLLETAQRATTRRTRTSTTSRRRRDQKEEHPSNLPDVYVIIQEHRAHVPTHLEHARTPHTPIITPRVYSWLLCICARNRHLCITRHISFRGTVQSSTGERDARASNQEPAWASHDSGTPIGCYCTALSKT